MKGEFTSENLFRRTPSKLKNFLILVCYSQLILIFAIALAECWSRLFVKGV